tara:strand:+ start:201 stop:338 length:138 start_codon:yes stop_codon:yes gene_type:complete
MKNLNLITKQISNENQKVSVYDSSKLLAKFFNGVIIQFDKEYIHE